MHPQYGRGTVKAINEYAAEILFTDGRKPVDPEASSVVPAEPPAAMGPASKLLPDVIRETVAALVAELDLETPDASVNELGKRWVGGSMILKPADPGLQPKEVELDVFFHKLVMMRNQLRVSEQKMNSSETLTSAEKFDWQQYITRCYGSMTTFNLLFKDKGGQFWECLGASVDCADFAGELPILRNRRNLRTPLQLTSSPNPCAGTAGWEPRLCGPAEVRPKRPVSSRRECRAGSVGRRSFPKFQE